MEAEYQEMVDDDNSDRKNSKMTTNTTIAEIIESEI